MEHSVSEVEDSTSPVEANTGSHSCDCASLLKRIVRLERQVAEMSTFASQAELNLKMWDSKLEKYKSELEGRVKKMDNVISKVNYDAKQLMKPNNERDAIISNIPEAVEEDTVTLARHVLSTLEESIEVKDILQATRIESN